jgi:hypothetical protein
MRTSCIYSTLAALLLCIVTSIPHDGHGGEVGHVHTGHTGHNHATGEGHDDAKNEAGHTGHNHGNKTTDDAKSKDEKSEDGHDHKDGDSCCDHDHGKKKGKKGALKSGGERLEYAVYAACATVLLMGVWI